jgi:hypothetical protein
VRTGKLRLLQLGRTSGPGANEQRLWGSSLEAMLNRGGTPQQGSLGPGLSVSWMNLLKE